MEGRVSTIIPTIGRAKSLRRLLTSLALQTHKPDEVIVADGSDTDDIQEVLSDPFWCKCNLKIHHLVVQPPNAVKQRQAAIAVATGDLLLLLDDDVELEPQCVENLITTINNQPDAVAVMADFNNQTWSQPTTAWRIYLRLVCGLAEGEWQGKVIGPLLRFGYSPSPSAPMLIEWLGAGNSLIRQSAYEKVGGFSNFFLHRCTINEDVDLGIKLSRVGKIYLCPAARLAHFHDPSGRISTAVAAEDDLFNRFLILRQTLEKSIFVALGLILTFLIVEFTSSIWHLLHRGFLPEIFQRLKGQAHSTIKIFLYIVHSN